MSTRLSVAAIVAIAAFAAARGDRRVVAYLLVTGAAAAAIAVVARRRPQVLTPNLTAALGLCAVLHVAGGLLPGHPVFYETWLIEHVLKYDQLVHFTITATLTVLARRITGRTTAAIALALAAGIGNELFEAASSLRFADAYVGGFTNAAWDLVFNTFGAATAAAAITARSWSSAPGQTSWSSSSETSSWSSTSAPSTTS